MCGIAGLVCFSKDIEKSDIEHRLNQSVRNLRHRGINDAGIYFSPDNRVALGHTRLSVMDLSPSASQPMKSHSGMSAITFNGEIYNFKELKSLWLESPFRTQSDTEVLIEGLEKHGTSFLSRLDGMFAFGFYNDRGKSLLLATDPVGKKPIYTYEDNQLFAFASEIKALRPLIGRDLEVDPEMLKEYLAFGVVPWPNTIYRNIKKLPAGCFQWVHGQEGAWTVTPYWDLPIHEDPSKISYSDAKAELQGLIQDSVIKRLRADVPVGSFLSGGLDSSVISLEANRHLLQQGSAPLKTFSIGYDRRARQDRWYDESHYSQWVAQRIGSDHQMLRLNPSADFEESEADSILAHFDEPFGDSSAIPTYFLCKEASKQVTVALSGDGADELFGGYLRFRAVLWSEKFGAIFNPLLKPISGIKSHPRSLLGTLARFQSALKLNPLERLIRWNSFYSEQELGAFLGRKIDRLYQRFESYEKKLGGVELGNKLLYINFKDYLFDDLLVKTDRMSMMHSLEVRSPFLDRRLIEFAWRLPVSFKYDLWKGKKILKDLYRKELGSKIVDRKKHGFAFPLNQLSKKLQWNDWNCIQGHFPKAQPFPTSGKSRATTTESRTYLMLSANTVLGKQVDRESNAENL